MMTRKPTNNAKAKLKGLRDFLSGLPAGKVEEPSDLESLLASCCEQFAGHDQESTAGYKLLGRMEDVSRWAKVFSRGGISHITTGRTP
ncbi:MAG TPA: hypothetical protein VKD72_24530 [Gemmataceae bacterium]|nr:hypothetical protein [Gemmataceae bacterium]